MEAPAAAAAGSCRCQKLQLQSPALLHSPALRPCFMFGSLAVVSSLYHSNQGEFGGYLCCLRRGRAAGSSLCSCGWVASGPAPASLLPCPALALPSSAAAPLLG